MALPPCSASCGYCIQEEEFKERFGSSLSSFADIPTRLREAAEKLREISGRFTKKK